MKTVRFEVVEIKTKSYSTYNIKAVEHGTARNTGEHLESFHRVNFAEDGTDFLSESQADYFVGLMNDGLRYRGLYIPPE